jgi:diguanylate cyclase (GGDEF)-like protein
MPSGLRSPISVAVAVVVCLAAGFAIDSATGAAPVQHFYYLPIVIAGLGFSWRYAGALVGAMAVVLYHLANPALLATRYREPDVVQVILFIAIGIVTSMLADDRRRLRRLSETDDLTGLYNLRGFEARLRAMLRHGRVVGTAVALLVFDVDRLKSINDVHGHLAGADAVRTVGRIVGERMKNGAIACRFGGDEFVVALPGRDLDAAAAEAQILRQAVFAAAPTLAGLAFPPGTLSISVGLACEPRPQPGPWAADEGVAAQALFRAADQALYVAKGAGRNQVRTA